MTDVARDFCIARSLLQRWKVELTSSKGRAFPGNGRVSGKAWRIHELEKKLCGVIDERDIPRKALAHFADDQR